MGAAEALGGLEENRARNAVRILDDFAVPEPNDRPVFGLEKVRADLIAWRVEVLASVQLDNEARLTTG